MSAEKLKAVLILGPDLKEDYDYLASVYGKTHDVVIGDGVNPLTKRDLNVLHGKIDQNTRVDINVHGYILDKKHHVLLNAIPLRTSELFAWLNEYSSNDPLQVHFWSCFGSAANADVSALGERSVLFNHISSQYELLSAPAIYSLKKNIIKLQQTTEIASSPTENFIDNLSHEMMQTASIAAYVNGKNHELILAPKLSEVVASPGKILEEEAVKITDFANKIHSLISSKDQNMYSNFRIKEPIAKNWSEQEKTEFRAGYFIHASYTGNTKEIVETLATIPTSSIKKLIDQDINSVSSLSSAVFSGRLEIVKTLIDHQANVNIVKSDGSTPLFSAAQEGYAEIVKILIENNADVNKAKNSGASPLWIATQKGHIIVLEILLAKGADINKANNDGITPILIASQKGFSKIVKMLTEHNADIDKENDYGETPLCIAITEGHTETAKILIEHNADVNKAPAGWTPIMVAAASGQTKVIKLLINNNADVNKANRHGETPLHMACRYGQLEAAKLLVNAKANLAAKITRSGETALDIAKQKHFTKIVKLLEDAIEAEQKSSVLADDHAHELIGEYGDNEATHLYQDEL